MSTLSLRLPDSLHEAGPRLAEDDHVSVNQLISTAAAEKVSALMTETYRKERAVRGSRTDFEDVMGRVPDVPPDPEDEV